MIKRKLEEAILTVLQDLSIEVDGVALEHPTDIAHGDFSTNIALLQAKATKTNPITLALDIIEKLKAQELPEVERMEVAGPGFINFYLSRIFFTGSIRRILAEKQHFGRTDVLSGKKVIIEYTDPNPFKIFHIGHLMANAMGESISRLIEWNGAEVFRACYQGDVGRHVAITIWALQFMEEPFPNDEKTLSEKVDYLGRAYILGSKFFEEKEGAADEVQAINKQIYDRSDAEINEVYDKGREWSLQYFEEIYKKLGTTFDRYFFESEMAKKGVAIVEAFLKKGVFKESDGAVIFPGEDHGLHTRVFINSHGIPTYEAKELGLNTEKFTLKDWDESIVVTANEQNDYFKVVLKALALVDPNVASKTKHISHGILRLPTGKMSSRKGGVLPAVSLIEDVEERVAEKMKDRELSPEEKKIIGEEVAIAAIKYSILKQAPGRDIIFDFDKSLSFEGDSGPYLQYAHTRALSVLEKAKKEGVVANVESLSEETHLVEKLLYRFPEIVERSVQEYAPQLVVTYLVELSSAFNAYYAKEKIVDKSDPQSPYNVAITEAFSVVVRHGLTILGIKIPARM